MSTPAPSFPTTRALVEADGADLVTPTTTGSTNADLLAAAAEHPHGSVVATLDQTAGRGRLDRRWSAPSGQTLAASVLVRAPLDDRSRGWLPLVAGRAMRDAVVARLGDGAEATRASRPTAEVKWPNDVLVDGRKVCGILCQVAADGSVVVGAGINLTVPADALPTSTSTSLAVAGVPGEAVDLADAVLADFRTHLLEAAVALAAGGAAADAVRSDVRAACGTIGRRIRLELPDGSVLEADAVGIDDEGCITIRDQDGATRPVAVGDVTHLRYA